MTTSEAVYSVTIPIPIVAKQGDRTQIVRRKFPFRSFTKHHSSDEVTANAEAIRWHVLGCGPREPIDGPLEAHIRFEFPWLKAHKDRDRAIPKCTAPDIDNLQKQIFDALQGVWYRNDARVWRVVAEKLYTGTQTCRVVITETDDVGRGQRLVNQL